MENEDYNKEELIEITKLRLPEILSIEAFDLVNTEDIKVVEDSRDINFKDLFSDFLNESSNAVILIISLKGDISANSGRLYPGITRMFLSFSVYGSKGEILWKKTYTVKRLDVKKPEDLSFSEKTVNYRKTLNKGFNEIERKGFLKELKTVF